MARLEYKYLVSMTQLNQLRRMILPHVELDPYAARRPEKEYSVRSVYLDTNDLAFYHEKLAGLRERRKLRIRGYNEYCPTASVFLEIKRKKGPAILKLRSILSFENLLPLLETSDVESYVSALGGCEEARDNARRFLFHFHKQALRPTLNVIYEREAFLSRFDPKLRITFDKNLRFQNNVTLDSVFEEAQALYALPNRFILEIKTNSGIPLWLQLVLSRLTFQQEALSKYVICILAFHDNGYNRLWTALKSSS
jgi:SPX domain protein involved in polyphosphate accumulation